MARIEATGLVHAPRAAVFSYLSLLENHWAVAGRWIEVVALAPGGAGGRVRIHGPLGLHRTVVTRVDEVDAPATLAGTAHLGRTCARVRWTLREDGCDRTDVRLEASVERAGWFDRALLALGGAAWMRRLFAATLAHLAERLDDGGDAPTPADAALSSARA